MHAQREFLLSLMLVAATPVFGQTAPSAVVPGDTFAQSAAVHTPDLSGVWAHPSLNGLEPPLSGAGPLTNPSRRTGPQAGVSSITQLVGDYTNPILQQWAAEVVKRFGEMSLAGEGIPPRATNVGPKVCRSSS